MNLSRRKNQSSNRLIVELCEQGGIVAIIDMKRLGKNAAGTAFGEQPIEKRSRQLLSKGFILQRKRVRDCGSFRGGEITIAVAKPQSSFRWPQIACFLIPTFELSIYRQGILHVLPFERGEINSKISRIKHDSIESYAAAASLDFSDKTRAVAEHRGHIFLSVSESFATRAKESAERASA